MGQSIKDQLKITKRKNNEPFRREILEAMQTLYDEWKEHADEVNHKRRREHHNTAENMETLLTEAHQMERGFRKQNYELKKRLERQERGRTWKFYLCCYLAALMGALTGIALCGAYWPTIMGLLGR